MENIRGPKVLFTYPIGHLTRELYTQMRRIAPAISLAGPRISSIYLKRKRFANRFTMALPPMAKAKYTRLAALLAAAISIAVPSAALDPGKTLTQYAHRIWGQEEGLFQPTIYSILQTHDGFLWLGTQDSLIRFDGAHFREFDGSGDPIFHRNLINALAEDHTGNLWVGSVGGGVAKIGPTGIATSYTTRRGLPSDTVFCLSNDFQGHVWVCTKNGLARFDDPDFRVFTTADGLPSNQVRSSCEAPDGVRWVAGLDFGLSRSNGSRFQPYSDSYISPKQNITALDCAKDGTVWVGTDSGLVRIRDGTSRSFQTREGLPDNAIASLADGPDGSLWIGTNDGISRFRNGEISAYRTRDGLSHSLVLALYVDREGSLWAGTKDGLDQFTDGKVTPYTTNEGMLSNDAGPVIEDRANRLWIGTLDRGLSSFDGRRFRSVTTHDGLLADTILSLELDKSGDLWVGTNRGLNRLRNGRVMSAFTRRDGLSGSEIRALFADAEGVLWAGTDRGLDRFDGTRFTSVDFSRSSKAGGVLAMGSGPIGSLFVSTDSAGFYSMQGRLFTSYPLDVIRSVDCYFLDRARHSTWMGTVGSGLLRWKNGKLTHVRVKDGLYDNRIFSILKDESSNFWLASSKGIFRVSQNELEDFADGKIRSITSIPFSTGQLRFECQAGVQPAASRTHDGRLWFSTTNGLVVVNPNHLVANTVAPPVQITSILINGERAGSRRPLDLKPSEKNVEIRYAGLSFVSPEKIAFRYILDGYDKEWTDAGSRREAFFTNLPPGRFRFQIMARNADGIWSSAPASLDFTIEPRIYQRAWFFPFLALSLALAIAAGYRMRIRRLNQRFDLVLTERSRIARELHDTLLQGLSGITMQLQALWTKLPVSKEKEILADIIGDAARCSKEARQSLWGLRTIDPGSLVFSDKLANLARQAVKGKSISLVLGIQPVSLGSRPDADYQLLRIAQEVIANTLSHANASTLEIALEATGGQLQLTFQDDGVGFTGSAEWRFGHFGLVGIRERAQEIGAGLDVTSLPGRGTQVNVRLPISSSAVQESNVEHLFEHQFK